MFGERRAAGDVGPYKGYRLPRVADNPINIALFSDIAGEHSSPLRNKDNLVGAIHESPDISFRLSISRAECRKRQESAPTGDR